MKVCLYLDEFGTSDQTAEQEYEYLEDFFKRAFSEMDFTFVRDVAPSNFQRCDAYVIDVGGIGLKNQSQMTAVLHYLNRLMEDNPSTAFVLWSFNTIEWFENLFPEQRHPNLINGVKNFLDDFSAFFQLK